MIEKLRQEISALDRQIADLLCQRLAIVEQVQEEKSKIGKAIEDLNREADVIALIKKDTPAKFHSALTRIYQSIFSAGKSTPTT